ncbi:hypothetical protein [Myceligenerans indicum]|uniref:hypothetical protein n=1 Tax=Myceligenerans indicum TaxID=2593663 RepID=UPI003556F0A0
MAVAEKVGATLHAVGRWPARFVEHRIAGLGDMPRSGGPRSVTDEQVAALVTRTLETRPKDATRHVSSQQTVPVSPISVNGAGGAGSSRNASPDGTRRCSALLTGEVSAIAESLPRFMAGRPLPSRARVQRSRGSGRRRRHTSHR